MFKYVLSLTFAVGLASAATISTSATCDGVTTVGTTSASCNDGLAGASASVAISHLLFVVEAQADTGQAGSSSSSANFSGDYVFTVLGATGAGFFYPCFIAETSPHGAGAGQGTFDGVSFGVSSTGFPSQSPTVSGQIVTCFLFPNPLPSAYRKSFLSASRHQQVYLALDLFFKRRVPNR